MNPTAFVLAQYALLSVQILGVPLLLACLLFDEWVVRPSHIGSRDGECTSPPETRTAIVVHRRDFRADTEPPRKAA